ncbi:hypothetical protein F5051DRAFT_207947 [Lentinula edodes]|nr:hypothetical protein F5051DRAFT_207947 [Lentinula edodes]
MITNTIFTIGLNVSFMVFGAFGLAFNILSSYANVRTAMRATGNHRRNSFSCYYRSCSQLEYKWRGSVILSMIPLRQQRSLMALAVDTVVVVYLKYTHPRSYLQTPLLHHQNYPPSTSTVHSVTLRNDFLLPLNFVLPSDDF